MSYGLWNIRQCLKRCPFPTLALFRVEVRCPNVTSAPNLRFLPSLLPSLSFPFPPATLETRNPKTLERYVHPRTVQYHRPLPSALALLRIGPSTSNNISLIRTFQCHGNDRVIRTHWLFIALPLAFQKRHPFVPTNVPHYEPQFLRTSITITTRYQRRRQRV